MNSTNDTVLKTYISEIWWEDPIIKLKLFTYCFFMELNYEIIYGMRGERIVDKLYYEAAEYWKGLDDKEQKRMLRLFGKENMRAPIVKKKGEIETYIGH